MTNTLNDAASYFRPLCEELLQRCAKIGVPCRIVDIIRDEAQQKQKLADGLSWTPHSKHLPQPPEEKSEAIDIVPLSVLSEHKPDWDPTHPDWQRIGEVGKGLGLRWGGDFPPFIDANGEEHSRHDPSHFEYVHKPTEPGAMEDLTNTTT
jgi:peptidoglycan L-alanyl-D-glutamate endopeptidase CwlK